MPLRIPPRLNDGYSRIVNGIPVRSMLLPDRDHVFDLIRQGRADQANEIILSEPYVFGDTSILTDEQRQEIWVSVVEYPEQDKDVKNLIFGAKLRMQHPKLAQLSCDTCRKYVVDPDTWEVVERFGRGPLPRNGGELLCETERGCPRGTWKAPIALSEKNTQTWNHYWEWRLAGMPLPDCSTQRRNWMLLHWITEHGCTRQLFPTIRPTV